MRKGSRLRRQPVTLRRAARPIHRTPRAEIIPPEIPIVPLLSAPQQESPFVGYSRTLTPEGGILITYKDFDISWRWMMWLACSWTGTTGLAYWLIWYHWPAQGFFLNSCYLLVTMFTSWQILKRPPEVSRSIEIRADCMIIEGTDVFWLRDIGDEWPSFKQDENHSDRQILCGIYGTRYVEYITVHRTDDLDRTQERLASDLHDAMTKLWGDGAAEPGTAGPSSPFRWKQYRRR